MDDVTEDDIALLSSETSSQWLKLPGDTSMNGLPVYLKIASSIKTSRLVVLLTDIRSGVWCEVFSELRALHVRIRVSARDITESQQSQSQSQISELKAEEAASQLFTELADYAKYANQRADLTIKSDAELEVLLHLPSLSFKLRLDKLSQNTSHVLLYDFIFSPLVGIAQAILSAGVTKLEEHPHTVDEAAKQPIVIHDLLLAAMQRFRQAAAGVAKDQRHTIAGLSDAPEQSSKQEPEPDDTKPAESASQDPDATMDSPPPRADSTKRGRSSWRPKSSSPPKDRRQSKGKAKADANMDGSATEESEEEEEVDAPMAEEEEQVHKPASKAGKRQRITSPSSEEEERPATRKSEQPAAKAETPEPPKPSKPKKAPKTESSQASQAPPQSTPQVPVLRRPAAGRGGPAKRGRGGMNWSNFG